MNPARLSHQWKSRHGMALFEVLLALTLFATVAFSLMMALHSAFGAATERNQIDIAMRGLDNQLALLHAQRINPADKDLPDDGSGVGYHLAIGPEQMQDQKNQAVPGMYRATITAKWRLDGQEQTRAVSELLYQP
ncbi:MAG TPA: hypothetical protein VL981_00725 [Candidatus Methylacidiphilales bacterium]|nr:hypothetical protein [Candidatus Methylacidiphilales bacterium]